MVDGDNELEGGNSCHVSTSINVSISNRISNDR